MYHRYRYRVQGIGIQKLRRDEEAWSIIYHSTALQLQPSLSSLITIYIYIYSYFHLCLSASVSVFCLLFLDYLSTITITYHYITLSLSSIILSSVFNLQSSIINNHLLLQKSQDYMHLELELELESVSVSVSVLTLSLLTYYFA